jgi:hypothetical protein
MWWWYREYDKKEDGRSFPCEDGRNDKWKKDEREDKDKREERRGKIVTPLA